MRENTYAEYCPTDSMTRQATRNKLSSFLRGPKCNGFVEFCSALK
jgi:hypothetical protein